MRKGFASNYRLVIIMVAVGLCFVGIGVRLVFLHVIDRETALLRVAKARESIIVEKARRGDIRDAKGNVLATSKTKIELGVDPQSVKPEEEKKWRQLAELIQVPYEKLLVDMTTKTRVIEASPAGNSVKEENGAPRIVIGSDKPESGEVEYADDDKDQPAEKGVKKIGWTRLCEEIDESVYDQVEKLKVAGVYGRRGYRRVYPQDGLAAHVIGYVNKQEVASAGIERYADFYLKGQNGWILSERDAKRRELAQFRSQEVAPVNGYDVVLSIDSVVQHMVEEEITYIVGKFKPKKVSIIVSDPRTGFLLAMANYPSFNLNEYGKADIASLKNVALTDVLEPGSTFKIVAAAAALNEGLVTPSTKFDCALATIPYRGREVKLPKEDHKFEHPLNVREILSHSSNKGAAQMAVLVGDRKYYDYARAFNFGQRTGFPSDSESRGTLYPPEKWSLPDLSRMAMGHAMNATPIQVHCAMQTIASGGRWLRPQIIREIRDSSGEIIFRYEAISEREVIRPETAEKMAAMLKWVTVKEEGTATTAAISGFEFEVAGKTGTTQKLVDGKYVSNKHVASFVGFFPASRPAVVISIIVDEATQNLIRNTAYGSLVAAPSFKHIGEQLVPYLNIRPVVDLKRPASLAMGVLK